MKLLDTITEEAAAGGLLFLVVGGHAVNAYGVGRQTADLDLLVREEDAPAWKALLKALDYRLAQEHEAFLQFQPADSMQWPVDLILVDDATLDRMHAAGKDVNFSDFTVSRVPSALHLIALKLHALKQAGVLREMQDLPDIVGLIEAEAIDYTDTAFKEFCTHYGNEALYQQIAHHCRQRAANGG